VGTNALEIQTNNDDHNDTRRKQVLPHTSLAVESIFAMTTDFTPASFSASWS
jgi:hypothetical protein